MKRITVKKSIDGCTWYKCDPKSSIHEAIQRVGACEDSGLMPEEIFILQDMDHRAKMAEMLRKEDLQAEIACLKAENGRLSKEAEAAVEDLLKWKVCGTCTHFKRRKCIFGRWVSPDGNFAGCRKWLWRGTEARG